MARIEVSQLLERLAKGKTLPGILLLGGELYLRDTCREKIVEAYVPPEGREWGVTLFSALVAALGAAAKSATVGSKAP